MYDAVCHCDIGGPSRVTMSRPVRSVSGQILKGCSVGSACWVVPQRRRPTMTEITSTACLPRPPWNKGKITGPKPPLRPSHVWAIRAKLDLEKRTRDLALFNLAIDSKLRGCDLVALRVNDVAPNVLTEPMSGNGKPAGPFALS